MARVLLYKHDEHGVCRLVSDAVLSTPNEIHELYGDDARYKKYKELLARLMEDVPPNQVVLLNDDQVAIRLGAFDGNGGDGGQEPSLPEKVEQGEARDSATDRKKLLLFRDASGVVSRLVCDSTLRSAAETCGLYKDTDRYAAYRSRLEGLIRDLDDEQLVVIDDNDFAVRLGSFDGNGGDGKQIPAELDV